MKRKSKYPEKNTVRFDFENRLVYIECMGKFEGRVCITDIDSYFKHKLYNYRWFSSKHGYVYTRPSDKTIYMHRLITGNTNSKMHTDHINNTDDPIKDKLDNRSENLRICSNSQNQHNSRKRTDNGTGYKGIHIQSYKGNARYAIHTRVNGKKLYFGCFKSEQYDNATVLAAYGYDYVMEYLHGQLAQHNQIKQLGLLTVDEMVMVEEVVHEYIVKHGLVKVKSEVYENVILTNHFVDKFMDQSINSSQL